MRTVREMFKMIRCLDKHFNKCKEWNFDMLKVNLFETN